MEKLRTSERIPTKEELTRLVDGFVETVKCLMDVRGVQRESTELDMTYVMGDLPLSIAINYHRETVLEDETVIRFEFNPAKLLDDGAVPVRILIGSPEDKYIKIPSLKDARLPHFCVTNYDKRGSYDDPKPEKRSHGFQFVAGGKNFDGKGFGVDGFSGMSEDANNAIRLEILQVLHKLIVDAMYQPYQRPMRSWFQKVLS